MSDIFFVFFYIITRIFRVLMMLGHMLQRPRKNGKGLICSLNVFVEPKENPNKN